jgi:excinuclease ABC subunit C
MRAGAGHRSGRPRVYQFRDQRDRVIYVGEAKSLRPRLNSYFAGLIRAIHPEIK